VRAYMWAAAYGTSQDIAFDPELEATSRAVAHAGVSGIIRASRFTSGIIPWRRS
jgi:hypothetical protein